MLEEPGALARAFECELGASLQLIATSGYGADRPIEVSTIDSMDGDDTRDDAIQFRRTRETLLSFVILLPWLSFFLHRSLELYSRRYREWNVRAFEDQSVLNRAFQILDLLILTMPSGKPSEGTGKDFTGVEIGAGFQASKMHVRFHKADFRETQLHEALFYDVFLRKTIWVDASIVECVYKSCTFDQAIFTPSLIRRTKFEDCTFQGARIAGKFEDVRVSKCFLADQQLRRASFAGCRFDDCSLKGADLSGVDLRGARFENCDLSGANLSRANMRSATLVDCDLRGSNLTDSDITDLTIRRCAIFGISLWGTKGEVAEARNLSLAKKGEPATLEVDGLHIAIFVASLIDGNGVRDLVDGLSSTMVLVLGRFTPPHKKAVDEIRATLQQLGFSAVVFDSALPRNRDATETIGIVARLSRFVIADLTAPKSSPHELQQFIADCAVPVQAVTRGEAPFSMFSDLRKYPWVMPQRQFESDEDLMRALPEIVAELDRRREQLQTRELEPSSRQLNR